MVQTRPAAPTVVARTEIAYAGFWRRLLAYLIDSAVLGAVETVLIFGAVFVTQATTYLDLIKVVVNAELVAVAIGWAYFAVLESSPARGTLGKYALGLFVGDVHGDPITFVRASVRYLLKSLSTLFLMVGWVMAAFTPRKQALHDLLAGTLVLRKINYLVIGEEPPTEPGEYWDGTRWVATVNQPLSMENL